MQSPALSLSADVRRFALLVIATQSEPLVGALASLCRKALQASEQRQISGGTFRELHREYSTLRDRIATFTHGRPIDSMQPPDPLVRIHIPEELQILGTMSVLNERLVNMLLRNRIVFRDISVAVPEDGIQQCMSADLNNEAAELVARLTKVLTQDREREVARKAREDAAKKKAKSSVVHIPEHMLRRLQSLPADATPAAV